MMVQPTQDTLFIAAGSINHAHAISREGDDSLANISHDPNLLRFVTLGRVGVAADQLVAMKNAYLLRQIMQMAVVKPEPSSDSEQHNQQQAAVGPTAVAMVMRLQNSY